MILGISQQATNCFVRLEWSMHTTSKTNGLDPQKLSVCTPGNMQTCASATLFMRTTKTPNVETTCMSTNRTHKKTVGVTQQTTHQVGQLHIHTATRMNYKESPEWEKWQKNHTLWYHFCIEDLTERETRREKASNALDKVERRWHDPLVKVWLRHWPPRFYCAYVQNSKNRRGTKMAA